MPKITISKLILNYSNYGDAQEGEWIMISNNL